MSDKIGQLLKKTEHYDADERFMAIQDLMSEMETNPAQFTAEKQVGVRNVILKMLDDKSSDVVTIATRCLSIIVKQFSADECMQFVDRLGTLILDPKKASSRDTWVTGIKTIISATRPEDGKIISSKLTENLLKGLKADQKSNSEDGIELQMVCLDLLKDLLDRFAADMGDHYENIVKEVNRFLEHPNPQLRKRANITLGGVVASLPENQFNTLMEKVVQNIEKGNKNSQGLYTYIQSVGVISASAALRVGKYLARIVPRLIGFCDLTTDKLNVEVSDSILELWETCFQTFQALLLHCPQEVGPNIPPILATCTLYIRFDPNYAGDEDKGDNDVVMNTPADEWGASGDNWGGGSSTGKNDWGGGGGADEQADTRDLSWRVRRGAVGVIAAFIRARDDILRDHYAILLESIVDRFKERDSNVQEDVFLCCRDLLRESVIAKRAEENKNKSYTIPQIVRTRSVYETMDEYLPKIVRECDHQFKKAKTNVKRAIYAVLKESTVVRSKAGNMGEHLSKILPHVKEGILSKEIPLKADALYLMQVLVLLHNKDILEPFITDIAETVCTSVQSDAHPPTKADGLRVLGVLADKLTVPKCTQTIQLVFKVVYAQLTLPDASEAVKENAIHTSCTIVAFHGEQALQRNQTADVVKYLVNRLDNEATRIAVLRGITTLARYPHTGVDFSPLLSNECLEKITSFLRKNIKDLKSETAIALVALIRCGTTKITGTAYQHIIKDVSSFISDNDLALTAMILDLYTATLEVNPASDQFIAQKEIMGTVLALTKSPVLQGVALKSLIAFYRKLASMNSKAIPYSGLLEQLLSTVNNQNTRQGLEAVSQCVAGIITTRPEAELNHAVENFMAQVEGKSTENEQVIALLIIGEIGRGKDLGQHQKLDSVVTAAFKSQSQSVKQAASFALGNIAVGNLSKYVPFILDLIKKSGDDRFLLLGALKETIARHLATTEAQMAFEPYVDSVYPLLLDNAESKDEGPRNLVAECFGRLAIIDGAKIIPHLGELAKSNSPRVRVVVITAIRFALSKDNENVNILQNNMALFLGMIKDPELSVRHQAVLTINAVARANIQLVESQLINTILPVLYTETEIKKELIEEKDFGNFTETIDHGFPMRLAVFQCLETLLDSVPHRIKKRDFILAIGKGLEEKSHLIQLRSYNMLYNLAELHANDLLETVDDLYSYLVNGAKHRIKDISSSNATAKDQATEVLYACVRTVLRIAKIPGVELCPKFMSFHKLVMSSNNLKPIVADVSAAK